MLHVVSDGRDRYRNNLTSSDQDLIRAKEQQKRELMKMLKEHQRRRDIGDAMSTTDTEHSSPQSPASPKDQEKHPVIEAASPPTEEQVPVAYSQRAETAEATKTTTRASEKATPSPRDPRLFQLRGEELAAVKAEAQRLKDECDAVLVEAKDAAENDEALQKATYTLITLIPPEDIEVQFTHHLDQTGKATSLILFFVSGVDTVARRGTPGGAHCSDWSHLRGQDRS